MIFPADSTTDLEPNSLFSFASDYYLNNESLEQNELHFITKKLKGQRHEFVALFVKPEIEQNISSGSKLMVFDLTKQSMSNLKGGGTANYGHIYQYGQAQKDRAKSLNFNTAIWNTLRFGDGSWFLHNLRSHDH